MAWFDNVNNSSTWNRWDLHIHTPYSSLHNEFGDPDSEKTWNNYLKELILGAYDHKIVAIGITDYFMIDGYIKVKKMLQNKSLVQDLFSDRPDFKEIKEYIENVLLILPNVELRLDCFVDDSSKKGKVDNGHSVNIHVIFSNKIPSENINENFLSQLKIKDSVSVEEKALTKNNISALGKRLKEDQPDLAKSGDSDLKVGLRQISVELRDIQKRIHAVEFRDNAYIITAVDEDLSRISWSSRDHSEKKYIYKASDGYFTSNKKTRDWAITDSPQYLREFAKQRPCIHGSDAHDYRSMFNPAENRCCWIKTAPSFDGFRQIFVEPRERVFIGSSSPQSKSTYSYIKKISIEDTSSSIEIPFSPYLNCIIGGKSTGKTILLSNIAEAIDQKQVQKKNELSSSRGTFQFKKVLVQWADGTTTSINEPNEKKMTYIPQAYLNRISENRLGEDSSNLDISNIIEQVMVEQEGYAKQLQNLNEKVSRIHGLSGEKIAGLRAEQNKCQQFVQALGETGSAKEIQSEINHLVKERDSLSLDNNIQKILVENQNLLDEKTVLEKDKVSFEEDLNTIDLTINNMVRTFVEEIRTFSFKSKLSTEFKNEIGQFSIEVGNNWKTSVEKLHQHVKEECEGLKTKLEKTNARITQIRPEISKNARAGKLSKEIAKQSDRLSSSKDLQKNINDSKATQEKLISDISKIPECYHKAYEAFLIGTKGIRENVPGINLVASIKIDKAKVKERISEYFDGRSKIGRSNLDKVDLNDFDEKALSDMLGEALHSKESLLKRGKDPLDYAEQLCQNYFVIVNSVNHNGDDIEQLSPGSKSLTLLKILVDLDQSTWPILLDQPEDDLDNRSVFLDLVNFLTHRKNNRQIIVVTHNANIVVAGDSEEVIVANQNGEDTQNDKYRFEYRFGPIENIETSIGQHSGVLYKTGLRDLICDILEGGAKAFELRDQKYSSVLTFNPTLTDRPETS
ncbi:ATPase involved in DNA repair [Lacticaseibacillus paracasei subsp. tolerans Lpl7]|uniref:ATPase involved in DNA repair n=1 Tax=Lacticaseibacillus paracasei subsp. tolerans Lpl14 TaxID=1256229 RepID=A0A829GRN2_LACPA|nr:hypothetical protein [Lacticaseibacillus paracasei]EPC12395.1 ATPase involved in DNA repair [Lacticaseibacillus paracasei subsp. tolerans Lpl7]EPC62880.1 hypothetical protein Lpl14_14079 [Lacticaseibacillus paracasei subsp. tolerans Lpl14]